MVHRAVGSSDRGGVRIDQHRASRHDLNGGLSIFICFIKDTGVVLVAVLTDDLIFLGDERREIDAQVCGSQPRIAGMGSIVNQAGGLNQVLGGQAAPVDTGTPQGTALGHHRRFAQVSGMNSGSEGG